MLSILLTLKTSIPAGKQFLLYDNYNEERASPIIIYVTKSNLVQLWPSKSGFMDGAFKVQEFLHKCS
jgi:hypothetical protein